MKRKRNNPQYLKGEWMYKSFVAMTLAVCLVVGLAGCKDEPADIVKSDAEYKSSAEKEISKENMLDELDKMEKAIDQDTESE
jgi:hypothetical protein